MAPFYAQGLLFLVLFIFISEYKADLSTDTVSASLEEDAVLSCFNSTLMDPKSCYRVRLVKYPTDASTMKVILAWPKNIQGDKRVKWEQGKDGQMRFNLTKVQKSDEGLYKCEVCQGWDCTLVKNISLKVKDCKTYSPVKAALSTAINLNCSTDIISGQQGPQNISWAMLKGGNPVSVNLNRVKINDTLLVFSSVTASDSGWYRCQYLIGQTQRCFDIKLIVQVENVVKTSILPFNTTTATQTQQALTSSELVLADRTEESSGAYIAVVASVIVGTVIIAALIALFIYRRCNTPRVPQQIWNYQAGAVRESTYGYEIVTLTASGGDPSNQQVRNVLYQQCGDDNMCTFHY